MKNKFFISLLLCLGIINGLKAINLNKGPTFKGYRFLLSAGVNTSLSSMLVAKNHRLNASEFILPNLGAEIVLNARKSIKLDLTKHEFNYTAKGTTELTSIINPEIYRTNIEAKVQSIGLNYRKYSHNILSIAPQGRFVSYGLSLNSASFRHSGYSFRDNYFNATRTYLPTTLKVKNFIGLRMENGRKFFLGKGLKHAIEFSFSTELFLLKYPSSIGFRSEGEYNNLNEGLVSKGMKYIYINSMIQFKASYALPVF